MYNVIFSPLRSLGPDGGGSEELLSQFLEMISACFESRMDFEAAQAYLGLFLKVGCRLIILS